MNNKGTHSYIEDIRNENIKIYINGTFYDRKDAKISVFDSGFLLGDGVWEGVLKWRPEETGRPSLKLVARDGEGESASIDIVTRTLTVEEAEQDQRVLFMALGATGVMGGFGLLAFFAARRRRALAVIDLITSWEAFRSPESRESKERRPLEGNIMDGTEEVQSELDELL